MQNGFFKYDMLIYLPLQPHSHLSVVLSCNRARVGSIYPSLLSLQLQFSAVSYTIADHIMQRFSVREREREIVAITFSCNLSCLVILQTFAKPFCNLCKTIANGTYLSRSHKFTKTPFFSLPLTLQSLLEVLQPL